MQLFLKWRSLSFFTAVKFSGIVQDVLDCKYSHRKKKDHPQETLSKLVEAAFTCFDEKRHFSYMDNRIDVGKDVLQTSYRPDFLKKVFQT